MTKFVCLLIILGKCRIMDRERQLSILYQKQGRATQFSSKASRDKWLQKEIGDLERVLSSNFTQVFFFFFLQVWVSGTVHGV